MKYILAFALLFPTLFSAEEDDINIVGSEGSSEVTSPAARQQEFSEQDLGGMVVISRRETKQRPLLAEEEAEEAAETVRAGEEEPILTLDLTSVPKHLNTFLESWRRYQAPNWRASQKQESTALFLRDLLDVSPKFFMAESSFETFYGTTPIKNGFQAYLAFTHEFIPYPAGDYSVFINHELEGYRSRNWFYYQFGWLALNWWYQTRDEAGYLKAVIRDIPETMKDPRLTVCPKMDHIEEEIGFLSFDVAGHEVLVGPVDANFQPFSLKTYFQKRSEEAEARESLADALKRESEEE